MTDIAWLTDPLGNDRTATVDRLGGKGAGLAEMVQLFDLPVPPAFVITTDVCRRYLQHGWPDGLTEQIRGALDELGRRTGRRLGDPTAPLLVSVRSGAPVSMPGMMETVLNVGMDDRVHTALTTEHGHVTFADNLRARFHEMFTTATGTVPPDDPFDQVVAAVEGVFRSWNADRARLFRETEGIDQDLGTAVVVQAMVFGNLDDRSGTGVLFTRDPVTGADEPYGDYLPCAQGEDVVAGTRTVEGLDALRATLPEVHDRLLDIGRRLEHHTRDLCDIEFTVAGGELFVLQTRIGRRSPPAAVRIAVEMAEDDEFPLSQAEAVGRVDRATLDALAALGAVRDDAVVLARGIAASPGVGCGVLCTEPDRAAEWARSGTAVVLARAETSPADLHGMVGAAGLVTALGGAVSHAAVVARSWAIPAVTGATGIEVTDDGIRIDGRLITSGTVVTIDGTGGRVLEGDQRADGHHALPALDRLRQWAIELGMEPGEMPATTPDEAADRARPIARLDVARALALKGMAAAGAVADALRTDTETVDAIVASADELFTANAVGLILTPRGRAWLDEALAEERGEVDRAAIDSVYRRFGPLDRRFKVLVTAWQTGGQDRAAFEAMVAALGSLHDEVAVLVDETITHASRLAPFGSRFRRAVEAVTAEDVTMLASPLKDSYHTVWFEYHEELIHLSGRNRADEEAAT